MIKALANRVMEFENGLEIAKTTIGFCELPNWVAQTAYYKMGVVDGSIKPFDTTSSKVQEDILKEEELLQTLRNERTALEEEAEFGRKNIDSLRAEIAELEQTVAELTAAGKISTKPATAKR
jgi:hypothetical protein